MRLGRVGLMMVMISVAYATTDFDRDQIQQRIRPVGQVRIQEAMKVSLTTNQAAPSPKVEEVVKKSPGQAIYEQYCIVCHRDGIAGAPKFRNADEWRVRMSKKNLDALMASAVKGLNAMPPKGTCQDCTDADLKAAIQYMVPQS